jgi:hypothetical protein
MTVDLLYCLGSPRVTVKKVSQFGQRTNFCVFCSTSVQKIIRHFERYHKNETEVRKFMAMPKQSQERKSITSKLRLAGNHQYNVSSQDGPVIVARRTKSVPAEVIVCVNCLGYYAKGSLYRHKCKVVMNTAAGLVRKPGTIRQGRQLLDMARKGHSTEAAAIFSAMAVDEVSTAAKNDELVAELLELQLQKGEGWKIHWRKQMRHKLRLLGRFILEARKILPNCYSLNDILFCENFLFIVEAAKECGKREAGGGPGLTVPMRVGFLVKACAKIIKSSALRNKDFLRAKDAKGLLDNYKEEWGER